MLYSFRHIISFKNNSLFSSNICPTFASNTIPFYLFIFSTFNCLPHSTYEIKKKRKKEEIAFKKKNFNVLSFHSSFFPFFFFHVVEVEIERILLIQRSKSETFLRLSFKKREEYVKFSFHEKKVWTCYHLRHLFSHRWTLKQKQLVGDSLCDSRVTYF